MKKLSTLLLYFIFSGYSLTTEPVTIYAIPILTVVPDVVEEVIKPECPNIYPMMVHHHITSDYGYRKDPITGHRNKFHDGLDFRCPIGTPIIATMDGHMSGYTDPHGAKCVILMNSEYRVIYAHLSDREFRLDVKKDDVIGYSGNTGRSTGPHLHYSVYKKEGRKKNPIDAKSLMRELEV